MDVCAAVISSVPPLNNDSVQPTVCMSMVLDRNAQHPEAVVPNGIALDSGLVFEDVVHRLGEEADEGVPL
jgi:hypothetical protein